MALNGNATLASPYGKGTLGLSGGPSATSSGIEIGRILLGETTGGVTCQIDCANGSAETNCPRGTRCCKRCHDGSPEIGCIDRTQTCDDVFSAPADLEPGTIIIN